MSSATTLPSDPVRNKKIKPIKFKNKKVEESPGHKRIISELPPSCTLKPDIDYNSWVLAKYIKETSEEWLSKPLRNYEVLEKCW